MTSPDDTTEEAVAANPATEASESVEQEGSREEGTTIEESPPTEEELAGEIGRSGDWVWAPVVDPMTSEYDVFITSSNRISIASGSPSIAVTGMRVILSNHFAPLPICGHEFSSAQFLGRGSTEFSVQLSSIGTRFLEGLQTMVRETERNAREFRGVRGGSYINFNNNEFLRIAGIERGHVQGINVETDQRGTNLYSGMLSFSIDGDFRETIQAEERGDSSVLFRIVNVLLQRINVVRRTIPVTESTITASMGDLFTRQRQVIREQREERFSAAQGLGTRPQARQPVQPITTEDRLSAAQGLGVRRLAKEGAQEAPLEGPETPVQPRTDYDELRATVEAAVQRIGGGLEGEALGIYSSRWLPSGYTINETARNNIDITSLGSAMAEAMRIQGNLRISMLQRGVQEAQDPSEGTPEEREAEINRRRVGLIPFPISIQTSHLHMTGDTPESGQPWQLPIVQRYDITSPGEGHWLKRYLERAAAFLQIFAWHLPPYTFFSGEYRGAYWQVVASPRTEARMERRNVLTFPQLFTEGSRLCQLMYGLRLKYGLPSPLGTPMESYMEELQSRLLEMARSILEEHSRDDFETFFPGLMEEYFKARTPNPAYPDLDLPRHPETERVIDTDPDFFMWNESEEGRLNELGVDVARNMDQRLDRIGESYSQLQSADTWRLTNLGRSRLTGDSQNRNDDGSLSHLLGQEQDVEPSRPLTIPRIPALTLSFDEIVQRTLIMSTVTTGGTGDGGNEGASLVRRMNMFRDSLMVAGGLLPDETTARFGPVSALLNEPESRELTQSTTRDALRETILESILHTSDDTLTLRRAYPTFKLYFLQDDTSGARINLLPNLQNVIAYYDDFYNYNSVKEIRLIRTRKQPASLLILTLTNVSGILQRRRWSSERPEERPRRHYSPGLDDTEAENPLKRLMLKEGLKVLLKMGYKNNPSHLEQKFIGEIVEISFNSETSDEITIICQDYGAELAIEKKGVEEPAEFNSMADALCTLMCSPELPHFGRYDINPNYNPAEARNAASSGYVGQETGFLGGLVNPDSVDWLQTGLIRLRNPYFLGNNPADDNIYVIPPEQMPYDSAFMGVIDGQQADLAGRRYARLGQVMRTLNYLNIGTHLPLWLQAILAPGSLIPDTLANLTQWSGNQLIRSRVVVNGQTIWDVFKEAELIFPGWVGHPRNYGTRMTMFFGLESQMYWAAPITREEEALLQRALHVLRTRRQGESVGIRARAGQEVVDSVRATSTSARLTGWGGWVPLIYDIYHTVQLHKAATEYLDAEFAEGEAMAVIGQSLGRTFGRLQPFKKYHLVTSDNHILLNNIRASERGTFNAVQIYYGEGNVYTLKADDDIPPERIRTAEIAMPGVPNEWTARRAAAGFLRLSLKDVYKGELMLVGMNVNPYDGLFISDDRVGMYGLVDVEQVVDTFTPETGWITEITPDMVVRCNDYTLASTDEVYREVKGSISRRIRQAAPFWGRAALTSAAIGNAVTPAAYLGAYAAYCFIRWTQDLNPISIYPLMLGDRPFFAGLDNFKQDGVFASIRGRLNAEIDNITQGWRAFHLHGLARDFTIPIARALAGQGG